MRTGLGKESARASLEATALAWMCFWQGAGLEGFEDLHAPDFVDHSAAGRRPNRDGFRIGIEDLYRAFPDFFATIETMVVDQEQGLVAIRWSGVGHMRGSFLGMPASDRRVSFDGIEIIAIRDRRVTQRWGEWNEAAIRAQIGPR
ncbi:MAG: ester cyclase [Stellaceae bacterium]